MWSRHSENAASGAVRLTEFQVGISKTKNYCNSLLSSENKLLSELNNLKDIELRASENDEIFTV